MCFLTLMLFRGSFLYKWCLGATNQLQQKSVHRILYAPLGFFLQVSGRWSGWGVGAGGWGRAGGGGGVPGQHTARRGSHQETV